jgi:hypothetical protein
VRRFLSAGAIATLALAPAATASLGTGVTASPVALARPAAPGRAYTLPSLYVVNTGTVRSRYHVRVQRLSPGGERTLPANWVTLHLNDFVLAPHKSATVPGWDGLAADAAAGPYVSNLVASTTTTRRAGGTALGAAAATKLELTVSDPASGPPWAAIGAGTAGGVLLVGLLRGVQRSRLRIRIERANTDRDK